MKKRILCFGDSNTWGYVPGSGERFSDDIRWTGVAATLLAEYCTLIEDGVSSRTTVYDDPLFECRNGKIGLGYSLAAHAPLDLVVLSLGGNDLKYVDAIASYKGLEELLRLLEHADHCFPLPGGSSIFPNGLKVLILSPIHFHPEIKTLRPESSLRNGYEESLKFAGYFERVAKNHGAWFLDAAQFAHPSAVDCLHMDEPSHRALGQAVAKKIQEIFDLPLSLI